MRLPPSLVESPFFCFASFDELQKALGESISSDEKTEMERMVRNSLPPITSRFALAAMFGISPGLVWSLSNRSWRYYRTFDIPKGRTVRRINAPKVALKIIQTWLALQLSRLFQPADHIFGFISGRSHIDAAKIHCNAKWVFSIDIENFFPSTPITIVIEGLERMGFTAQGANLIAQLACLHDVLAQGAPSSPVLSNICFETMDRELSAIATKYGIKLTRYADDIVFSGDAAFPEQLVGDVTTLFQAGPWRLAQHKTFLAKFPNRLKVHGLLVHGHTVRLTKGYRKKLRAYQHLMSTGRIRDDDNRRVKGHLAYGEFVEKHRTV